MTPFLSVNIFKVNAASKKPKVKSLKEAIVILEDVTECLTSENVTETVNDLSKVLSNNYSVCLAESQNKSVRTESQTLSNESVSKTVQYLYELTVRLLLRVHYLKRDSNVVVSLSVMLYEK